MKNLCKVIFSSILVSVFILSGCNLATSASIFAPRIVVNNEDGTVDVLDGTTLSLVKSFPVNVSSITGGPDNRHVFMSHRVNGTVQVLDTGSYLDDKGKAVVKEPALYDYQMTGNQPAHIVSNAGVTTIFYDGSGDIDLYDAKSLVTTGNIPPVPVQHFNVPAHHGVAVSTSSGGFITSTPPPADKTRGHGVARVSQQNNLKQIDTEVSRLHGEAVTFANNQELFAFGGEKKVYLYNDSTGVGTNLALPDQSARVGALSGSHTSPFLIGNYGSKDAPDLAKNITVIDSAKLSLTKVDLATTYLASFVHDGSQTAYVLGTNGSLYVIDLATASITAQLPLIDAWTSGEGKITPSLAISADAVYVTNPTKKTIIAVELTKQTITESAPYNKLPKSITTA
ncbi:MAG: hypothetical protein ACRC6X_07675 [Culicoidibacterales bacterium]